ncbi:hypothetical protein C8J57DRAFT_555408 [Mycena rebaudengoi]|nr:hypothetical protein C8J57DRAFT_555408 [Mycena rebaudengoi]
MRSLQQYQPMIIPQDLAPQTSVTAPHLQQYQPMLIPLQPRAPQLPTATQHIPAAGSYGSVKEVQLTLVEPGVVEAPAVKYQTAEDLYSDLQKVLFNWHPAFHFHGTFSIVADRTIHNADRARIVSRQLLAQTILYFQMNLDVKTSYLPPYKAYVTYPSSTMTGATLPCTNCRHLLTVWVQDDSTHRFFPGQRVSVQLTHFSLGTEA